MPLGHGPHAAPVVVHALRTALACRALTSVVVVAPPDPDGLRQLTAAVGMVGGDAAPATPQVRVVPGGAERSDSVAAGLAALPPEVDVVLVHDAARALTPVEVFDRVVEAVRAGHEAVTPALPVTDTVKQVEAGADGAETVRSTLDRSVLRAVQTPQGFRPDTLRAAHDAFARSGRAPALATDDCGLVEAAGGRVTVVEGSPRALKITTAHDLTLAASWLPGAPDPAPDPAPHPDRPRGVVAPGGTDRAAWLSLGPALVVLSGLPGVGKTAIAREVCHRARAVHVRVDTIEQGLLRGGLPPGELGTQGYGVAHSVAADQLAVGLPVVADMVNGVSEARRAWEELASRAGARLVRVLVECSDAAEHRRRVEGRTADIEGHDLPGWPQARATGLAPWPEAQVRIDTAVTSVDEAADQILSVLQEAP